MVDRNAFKVVQQFEEVIADYTGAPYAVAVDSCSNAIFLSLMYEGVKGRNITIPKHTYPSVPYAIIHAGGKVRFKDMIWGGIYQLDNTKTIDAAKRFTKGMYLPGYFMCLSFHMKKHLGLGRGGAILTDNEEAVKWFKQARFDGRHEVPLHEDKIDMVGWNMYMDPMTAAHGLWKMMMMPDHNEDLIESPPYPDLSKVEAYNG